MKLRWGTLLAGAAAVLALTGCVSAPLYTSKSPPHTETLHATRPAQPPPPAQEKGSAWVDESDGEAGQAPLVTAGMIPIPAPQADPPELSRERVVETFRGQASYYAREFHGRKTASGERFDMHAMTAAHRTLAFGTRVRVVNADNGLSVVVRVNDRGPFKRGRVIDVSYAAAQKLGMIGPGTIRVKCEVLDEPSR